MPTFNVNGTRLDDSVQAAQEMGMRFHAARVADEPWGQSQGGFYHRTHW